MLIACGCLLLAACGDDGSGTGALGGGPIGSGPTPDLPDFLPKPEASLIGLPPEGPVVGVQVTGVDGREAVLLEGRAGAVTPGARVWVVNLDDEDGLVEDVLADADGAFSAMPQAREGDRLRVHERTDTQHSAPVDLDVSTNGVGGATFAVAQDTSLDCLVVEPADELRIAGSGSFSLRNDCGTALTLDARLRFGDAGFSLGATPTNVAVGETADISVDLASQGPTEAADILLLEVEGAGDGRYALGLWSVPL